MESVNKYESREIDSTKVISDTKLISLTDGVDRSNDHYDACVKVKSPEIHNVITYFSDIHKNLQFVLWNLASSYQIFMKLYMKSLFALTVTLFIIKPRVYPALQILYFAQNHTRHRVIHAICEVKIMMVIFH